MTTAHVSLLYVGSVLPSHSAYRTSAFSPAGSMFQENLISGLTAAGMRPSQILSVRHLSAFPRSRTLWSGGKRDVLPNGEPVYLLPFINVTPLKQLHLGFAAFVRIVRWGWQHRKSQLRVVYQYNLTVPPAIFTLAAARLIRAAAVVSINDVNKPGETVPDTLLYRFDYRLQQALIPCFDAYVVVAKKIAHELLPPNRPWTLVEGGIDKSLVGMPAESREATSGVFRIVAAGSLKEANGVLILLAAFQQLQGEEFELVLAGAGPLEAAVKEAASKDPRIKYVGMLSFDEVFRLYTTAQLLVNLRLTQAMDTNYFFPSKMMEYMASGTPVLTTCTGHIEEEFGEMVYLMRDESPAGVADSIRKVAQVDAKERMAMGGRAKEYMRTHKTWEVQGRKVAEFLIRECSVRSAKGAV